MAGVSIEEAARYRMLVRHRLSERNVIAALATAIGGGVGLAGALYTGHNSLTVGGLAGPCAMVVWHIHSILRPQLVCPSCADNWEYDGFLKALGCETCGLDLPTGPSAEPTC